MYHRAVKISPSWKQFLQNLQSSLTKKENPLKTSCESKNIDATTKATRGRGESVSVCLYIYSQEGMRYLHISIASINNDYLEDIELCALLATVVENLHAVSHFMDETFTVMQYSQGFGIITNESLKKVAKWAAEYFTHEKSFYPVPQTSMKVANVNFKYLNLQNRWTPRLKVLWKNLWRSIVRWGKGQFGRKLPRSRQGLYHWPSTRSNKITPKCTC